MQIDVGMNPAGVGDDDRTLAVAKRTFGHRKASKSKEQELMVTGAPISWYIAGRASRAINDWTNNEKAARDTVVGMDAVKGANKEL